MKIVMKTCINISFISWLLVTFIWMEFWIRFPRKSRYCHNVMSRRDNGKIFCVFRIIFNHLKIISCELWCSTDLTQAKLVRGFGVEIGEKKKKLHKLTWIFLLGDIDVVVSLDIMKLGHFSLNLPNVLDNNWKVPTFCDARCEM